MSTSKVHINLVDPFATNITIKGMVFLKESLGRNRDLYPTGTECPPCARVSAKCWGIRIRPILSLSLMDYQMHNFS